VWGGGLIRHSFLLSGITGEAEASCETATCEWPQRLPLLDLEKWCAATEARETELAFVETAERLVILEVATIEAAVRELSPVEGSEG
jgi:hypothetical protein